MRSPTMLIVGDANQSVTGLGTCGVRHGHHCWAVVQRGLVPLANSNLMRIAAYFFSGLKRLQIFDDRPALVFGEVGAVFVTAIAVAIRVRRIDDEAAALERRLVDVIADILRVEDAAADHEGLCAVLRGLQQFPKVRHRTVVKIGRGRPDAVQHARLVGGPPTGGGLNMLLSRRSMKSLIFSTAAELGAERSSRGLNTVSRFSLGYARRSPFRWRERCRLCVNFVGDWNGSRMASPSNAPDDRGGKHIGGLRRIPDPCAKFPAAASRRPQEIPGLTIRFEFSTIFGSVPTALTGVSHRPGNSGDVMHPRGNSAMGVKQSLAPAPSDVSSSPNISRGQGGGRSFAIFSSSVCSPANSTRIIGVIDEGRRERVGPGLPVWGEIREYAEHLAGIAAERLDIEAVVHAAVPLRAILLASVPEKG